MFIKNNGYVKDCVFIFVSGLEILTFIEILVIINTSITIIYVHFTAVSQVGSS